MSEKERQNYHLNIPQLMYSLVKPRIGVCVWGRFTGKTEGPGVDFTLNNIFSMPGSNGFIQGKTYAQLLERTLDALISGWEKRGFYENQHFWVGKSPEEKLMIPKSIREPISPKHYIKWFNGSGIYLVSQDKTSTINGVRTQWGFVDEAKFINKKKFDEQTIPTMAGGYAKWGHMSNYLSLLFCSDMPQHSSEKWLLDYEKDMDVELVEAIIAVQFKIMNLRNKLKDLPEDSIEDRVHTLKDIKRYTYAVNELRRNCIYFSTASALDNIDAIGLEPLLNTKRVLSDIKFRVQILNEQLFKNENGFYALLDPVSHSDNLVDYKYVSTESRGTARDSRWDADVITTKALHIACDHNNIINSIVTAQESGNNIRFLSSMYVLHPQLLDSMVEKWCDYYEHHHEKVVYYWFDSTSKKRNSMSDIKEWEEVERILIIRGWTVIRKDIGQIGSHTSRYMLWGKLFSGDTRLPHFIYNRVNCKDWEVSCLGAGLIKVGDVYNKDKSSEKLDSGVPPNEATHISEAGDILLWGMIRNKFSVSSDFVGIVSS